MQNHHLIPDTTNDLTIAHPLATITIVDGQKIINAYALASILISQIINPDPQTNKDNLENMCKAFLAESRAIKNPEKLIAEITSGSREASLQACEMMAGAIELKLHQLEKTDNN